jgi:hypothetical protein
VPGAPAAPKAPPCPNTAELGNVELTQSDRLLRRSFQAGGRRAPTQVGSRAGCPWVTADDRSFPSVLARMWHVLFLRPDLTKDATGRASSSRSQRAMRFARAIPPTAGPRGGLAGSYGGAGLLPARRTLNQGQAQGPSCDLRYVSRLALVPSRNSTCKAYEDSKDYQRYRKPRYQLITLGSQLPTL